MENRIKKIIIFFITNFIFLYSCFGNNIGLKIKENKLFYIDDYISDIDIDEKILVSKKDDIMLISYSSGCCVIDTYIKKIIYVFDPQPKFFIKSNYLIYVERKKTGKWRFVDLQNGCERVFDFWIEEIFFDDNFIYAKVYKYDKNRSIFRYYINLNTEQTVRTLPNKKLEPIKFDEEILCNELID